MELPVYTAGIGEPILMIHGIISDSTFFLDVAEHLKKKYKVIAYDRRGYGRNLSDGIEDFSVCAQAIDAAEVLRQYAETPAWIVGNSAGGLIAIELCLQYPELIKGMILVEPSLVFDDNSKNLIQQWNDELNGYRQEKKIKKALTAFSKITGRQEGMGHEVSLKEMKQTYKNLNNFMYGELNEVQHYFPNIESVKSIRVPVCVLISERGSETIFAKTSKRGADLLKWEIRHLPGYHNAIKEDPDSSAQVIASVLADMRNGDKA